MIDLVRRFRGVLLSLASPALLSCAASRRPAVVDEPARAQLAAAEQLFATARALKDEADIAGFRAVGHGASGDSLPRIAQRYDIARRRAAAALDSVPGAGLDPEGVRALATMRRVMEGELTPALPGAEPAARDSASCRYDAAALARTEGEAALRARAYACYGRAARRVMFEGALLDRLTVLGTLPLTSDSGRRRDLFLALAPVWASMNGDDGSGSPYRQLLRFSAERWAREGSPAMSSVRALGIDPSAMESWLIAVLEAWRQATPDEWMEPWDYHFAGGAASRALVGHIPRERLAAINERFYADLGASPAALGIRYDLDPRDGKTPVAFTTFGARGTPGMRGVPATRPTPWVFATYRVGGLDNLGELLHETGHGVHIAAVRTRPAFADWPDSDPYSEALGDLAALEMYEPPWQARYLGDSVPLATSLRAKYSSIVLDIAWALFEVRMHARPDADPNVVWTEITSRYLRVRPHPDLSWWAMRGQLLDVPGYMMNYAVGAIVVADLRAAIRDQHGSFTTGDPGWYGWVSDRLYRFGLARPTREVIGDVLGRPVSPRALLDDLARMERGRRAHTAGPARRISFPTFAPNFSKFWRNMPASFRAWAS